MSIIKYYIIIICLGICFPILAQSDDSNKTFNEISNDTIVLQNAMEFYDSDVKYYPKDQNKEMRNLFVRIDGNYIYYNRKKINLISRKVIKRSLGFMI